MIPIKTHHCHKIVRLSRIMLLSCLFILVINTVSSFATELTNNMDPIVGNVYTACGKRVLIAYVYFNQWYANPDGIPPVTCNDWMIVFYKGEGRGLHNYPPNWLAYEQYVAVYTNPPAPTCNDGIQNQGEAGVDCGGPCSEKCPEIADNKDNNGDGRVDEGVWGDGCGLNVAISPTRGRK